MHNRVGQQFGNYRLLRCLGQGGFAQVYLAEHVYLQTQAAIKILHMRLAQSELKGFLQEARIIAHMVHPHIIQIIDFGLEGCIPYLVMQYAQQGSLRQHHPHGSIVPLANIVTYIQAVASALQYAHSQHLIHRDVKPENMLLGKQHELLLSDFGVAIVVRNASNMQQQESGGTIAYMAPEQINGLVSPASDQYALAVVVYEWLCGKRPFNGTIEEVVQQHLHTSPLSPRVYMPTLSPAVEQVVLKALQKEPQHRYASIADFANALSQPQEKEGHVLASAAPSATDHVAVEQTSAGIPYPSTLSKAIPVQNIPYRRNPFFTGREDVLQILYSRLHEVNTQLWTYPQAISGLGGIGKTQTAIEYAYRYHADYVTILWARAETYETLRSDFLTFAHLLKLSEQDEQNSQNQERVIEAVKHWLEEHTHWLLILDNVEDLTMVNNFIPAASRGHCILTTRTQATGSIARCIDIEKLEPDDAALFLLRRAGIIQCNTPLEEASSADFIEARDIAEAMDGLPSGTRSSRSLY